MTLRSVEEIRAAATRAHREFFALGLLTRPLVERTPVVVAPTDLALDGALGLYARANMPLRGVPRGAVVVPALSLGDAWRRLLGRRASFPDTLRHELAHALAETSGRVVRDSSDFRAAFGADHDREARALYRRDCPSPRAMLNPAEDFAECVALWVRCGGRPPKFEGRPHLQKKLAFVASLPRRLRAAGLSMRRLPPNYRAIVRYMT